MEDLLSVPYLISSCRPKLFLSPFLGFSLDIEFDRLILFHIIRTFSCNRAEEKIADQAFWREILDKR